MITVSLPDSPLRLCAWRCLALCSAHMALVWGGITVFARRFLESFVAKMKLTVIYLRILLLPDLVEYNVLCSDSTRDRGSLHSPDW